MRRYLITRLARAVPMVVLISLLTFILLHSAPGGPVSYSVFSP